MFIAQLQLMHSSAKYEPSSGFPYPIVISDYVN